MIERRQSMHDAAGCQRRSEPFFWLQAQLGQGVYGQRSGATAERPETKSSRRT